MVKCEQCKVEFAFLQVQPECDQDGIYFICRICSHRNPLLSLGEHDGQIILVQPETDWKSKFEADK